MKRLLGLVLVAGIAFAAGSWMTARREISRYAAQSAQQQAAWESERAELESALQRARESAVVRPVPSREPSARTTSNSRPSPTELIARLQTLRIPAGSNPAPILREAVYCLEELRQAGTSALAPIREFLARYEDVELETSQLQTRNARDRVPLEFALPPSLRLGLFGVVRRIGGAEAESILAESLLHTGRGIDVAYLSAALQEMAPDKYRKDALTVTHALLASATTVNATSALDRNHREYLFGVLVFFGDSTFASEAQAQLVRTDSQIDRGALKYLQQTLGAQAVPIVAQAYQNPLLTNSAAKEPLARLALSFVGADAQANTFYQQAINDPLLTKSHRKNLIEDLNQDGFPDARNLSARDLSLIESRLALVEQLAASPMDDVNAAAFREAYKDLVNMRARIIGVAPQGTASQLPKP
jgi:hypothetical protein